MRKANHRKSNANTDTYVEKLKGKNYRERERGSTIIMTITIVILWYTRVSGLN